MKCRITLMMTAILMLAVLCGTALAAGEKDYSREGWYVVNSVQMKGSTFGAIYDRPNGANEIGRASAGDAVYVYWVESGEGDEWAYCSYEKVKGYIPLKDLQPAE